MPDDLLRYVGGPTPYSSWWLWLGVLLLVVVIVWYGGVYVATLPSRRLRGLPGVGGLHARLLRRRFARSARSIGQQHRDGELTDAAAGAAMSRTLRSFLNQATGTRVQYMHLGDIRASEVASAAPVLSALDDVQFNTASPEELGVLGAATEELIRSWP